MFQRNEVNIQDQMVDPNINDDSSVQTQPFVLSPRFVEITFPINRAKRIGEASYCNGSNSLPIKFDGEEQNHSFFTDGLMAWAREMGWDN